MKTKLFLALTVITLTFQACSNDDDSPEEEIVFPFAGTWSGTYDGDDNGTWILVVSDDGRFVSGSSYSNVAEEFVRTISATVTSEGITTSSAENGTVSRGQVTGETLDGTWVNPNAGNLSGTLTGSRR